MKLDKFNLGFGIFYIFMAVLTFSTWEKYIFIFFLACGILLLLKAYYKERMSLSYWREKKTKKIKETLNLTK